MSEFLTQDELARRWKISVYTLALWRRHKKGPPYMKTDGGKGLVRYPLDQVLVFEKESMTTAGASDEN